MTLLVDNKAIAADSGPGLAPGFRTTAALGAVGAVLIAILGLLGYVPGLRVLGSIRPDYIPMAPSTAASFLILGAALLRLSRRRRPGFAPKFMIALVSLVMLFSLLNVAGNITGMDLNFEARLTSGAGTIKGTPVSRMSPLTGAAFVLVGLGILLLLLRRRNSLISRRLGHCASSLGVLTVLGGSTVLLAYLYGAPLMYSGNSVPMAATTAIAFVLLGSAIAAGAGPESFPLRLVSGDSTSARLSRVFFPLTMAVVILQGLLSHQVSASAVIPNALFLAFLAIVVGTITVVVIVRVAHSLGGSLDKASEKLLEKEARLSKTQEMAHLGSWELDIPSRQLIWSDEVYRIFGLLPQEFPATYEAFLDSVHPQDRDAVDSAYAHSIKTGADSYEIEHRVVRKHSGEVRFVHEKCDHLRDASGRIVRSVGMVHDITERKQAEAYGEMGRAILHVLNRAGGMRDAIQAVIADIKARTGFDAVGIRLQDGDDFPYFFQDGFSGDFLLTENTLLERRADGGVCRDASGHVSLECTCGLVISGRTDPGNPYFSPGGSFWTNDSLPLLELPPDQDPRRHPRNQCIHQGYVSVALVPIRLQEKIVGLLQLNDRRPGRFSLSAIEQLENIAAHIGEALMRKQAEAEIERQLAEKEILLKEVHHRIKNNIASIGSLISLRMQSLSNPEALAVLKDTVGRVDSMRILYDKLLLSTEYTDISVKNYVDSLVDAIVALFPDSARVTVEKNIADFHLDAKQLFPLGLIINELITNKMKYAFIDGKKGSIRISLENADNHVTLAIQDDGIGLPDGFDMEKSKGFGLMLVKMLSQQLGGSFSMEKQAGTRCTVEFDLQRQEVMGHGSEAKGDGR